MTSINKLTITTLFAFMTTTISVSAADLTVNVDDISKHEGNIYVVLFDSANAYNGKGKPIKRSRIEVTKNSHSVVFKETEAGTYAIKLFHDENGNGKLDTNLVGIPSEGYGFSNNAGAFGPATFEDASFAVTETSEINIKLR